MKDNHRLQENGRFSAKRKTEAVLQLLRGEDLDLLSREYKVTAGKLRQWRDAFLSTGQARLQPGEADGRDQQIQQLQAKQEIGSDETLAIGTILSKSKHH